MSFIVPLTQTYIYGWRWLVMLETLTMTHGFVVTVAVDDWYWRLWYTCLWRSSSAAVPGAADPTSLLARGPPTDEDLIAPGGRQVLSWRRGPKSRYGPWCCRV